MIEAPSRRDCEGHRYLKDLAPWTLGIREVEQLSQLVLGTRTQGWVRKKGQRGIIASEFLGGDAAYLEEELRYLSAQCIRLSVSPSEAESVLAAIFYHLRFTAIHPLIDGNGRISRLILASQVAITMKCSEMDIMKLLYEQMAQYYNLFRIKDDATQFSLLAELIGSNLGLCLAEAKMPFGIGPKFPERDRRPFRSLYAQDLGRSEPHGSTNAR